VSTMDFSDAVWRKSSLSTQNGSCVEVAAVSGGQAPGRVVAVRDSKDPDGPVLPLTAGQWQAFTALVRTEAGVPHP